MKWIKKHKVASGILGIVLIVAIGFGICSYSWYRWSSSYWGEFLSKVERSKEFAEHEVYSIIDDEDITYLVKKPNFMSRVGNLSISYSVEDSPVGIIIWPSDKEKWEYGVMIDDENGGQFYVGEDMRPLDKADEVFMEKYYEDIDYLYAKAKNMWGF